MRLLIKQRVFSWTDSYDIYNENNQIKYVVQAEFLTLGHQLHVCDANQNEIGMIRQKILTFLPTFEIEIGGVTRGTIKKEFTLFRQAYDIDYNGWTMEGDFWGWDYEVYEAGRPIMHISKELLHWGDTYVIDIEDPSNELLGMMLVIAVDAANCSQKK